MKTDGHVDGEIRNSIFNFILADKKSKERSSSVGGQKKDKKVMELKATMKMYHDELEEAVSFFVSIMFSWTKIAVHGRHICFFEGPVSARVNLTDF